MPTPTVQGITEKETVYESRYSRSVSAATRNVDLIAEELAVYGHVTPELWAMVLDEELTHAAEILAAQEMTYAAVPRTYYQRGEDLINIHNQSLKRVFNDGIEYTKQEIEEGIAGADWELGRRKAELNNLQTIISMPSGTVCVEISASPYDKPKHEQLAQHYNGLTMIRASIKDQPGRVAQYNYALPVSSPEFVQVVQAKLGRKAEEQVTGSEEMLKNPVVEKVDQSAEVMAKRIDGLIGAALLEVSVGQSALRMITRAIENRREAWEFVTSANNTDVHLELGVAMQQAARLQPAERDRATAAIRSGFWKEFKDRFRHNTMAAQEGGILMAAASRAVADGDVFIACGSTVVATEFSTGSGNSSVSREQIVKNLREKVIGNGSCVACGAKGKLFGCRLCGGCNKEWCDIYKMTGRQTNIKNLAYLSYSRPTKGVLDTWIETFSEDWKRIGREIEQKRRIRKLREAEKIRLEKEALLAEAA